MAEISTIQSGIKHHTNDSLTDYALFMGGLNVTHERIITIICMQTTCITYIESLLQKIFLKHLK